MPQYIIVQPIELAADSGVITLPVSKNIGSYLVTGTATLTSNITITSSGTPFVGLKYVFDYQANIDITTNSTHLFIFGTELTQKQLQTQSTITVIYTGSEWVVKVMPDFENDAFIPQSKLENFYETINVPVSFETGEVTQHINVYLPYKCTIVNITATVTKALAGTDAGTIVVYDSVSSANIRTLTIPLSSALSTEVEATSVNYSFVTATVATNSKIHVSTAKTTAGGKAVVSILVKRT